MALLGVSGLAGGGLLWNFQGRTLGLGSTVTALVLLGISFVLLRPEPGLTLTSVEVAEVSQPFKIKAPQASILGLMLATLGTFGLAISGLLWNFQGLAFGLTGTLTASVALLLSLLFLWPLGKAKVAKQPDISTVSTSTSEEAPVESIQTSSLSSSPAQTTAEAIAEKLAAEQKERPELPLVNFAPLHLLPGQSLSIRVRRGGSSLRRYRSMANELFKS